MSPGSAPEYSQPGWRVLQLSAPCTLIPIPAAGASLFLFHPSFPFQANSPGGLKSCLFPWMFWVLHFHGQAVPLFPSPVVGPGDADDPIAGRSRHFSGI